MSSGHFLLCVPYAPWPTALVSLTSCPRSAPWKNHTLLSHLPRALARGASDEGRQPCWRCPPVSSRCGAPQASPPSVWPRPTLCPRAVVAGPPAERCWARARARTGRAWRAGRGASRSALVRPPSCLPPDPPRLPRRLRVPPAPPTRPARSCGSDVTEVRPLCTYAHPPPRLAAPHPPEPRALSRPRARRTRAPEPLRGGVWDLGATGTQGNPDCRGQKKKKDKGWRMTTSPGSPAKGRS